MDYILPNGEQFERLIEAVEGIEGGSSGGSSKVSLRTNEISYQYYDENDESHIVVNFSLSRQGNVSQLTISYIEYNLGNIVPETDVTFDKNFLIVLSNEKFIPFLPAENIHCGSGYFSNPYIEGEFTSWSVEFYGNSLDVWVEVQLKEDSESKAIMNSFKTICYLSKYNLDGSEIPYDEIEINPEDMGEES